MGRKGQLTVFILLGVVIVGFVSFVLFISLKTDNSDNGLRILDNDELIVKGYVESCVNENLKSGADLISYQGGYFFSWKNYYNLGSLMVSIYLDEDDVDFAPDFNDVKGQLLVFLEETMSNCVLNQKALDVLGVEIRAIDEPNFILNVNEDKDLISVNVDFGLVIESEDVQKSINQFYVQIEHPLFILHENAINILNIVKDDLRGVPVTKLTEYTAKENIFLEVFRLGNSQVLFSIVSELDSYDQILYNFVVDYSKGSSSSELDDLKIINLEKKVVRVGSRLQYWLEVNKDDVNYKAYTDLFDIEENGFINYTAKFEDLGTHYILIEVNDNFGNKSYEYFEVEVVSDSVPVVEKIDTQYVNNGELFVYDVVAVDYDNDVLFYSVEGLPDTAINPLTGRISYVISTTQSMLPVNVTVVDINGNYVTESFYIEVEI